ncbi:class I SAM-dependent methyltransferase [Patescibacteria group bacterium]|nr:class I SAM-dependent methyltransferase [Patescibacteria group bacterium]
MKKFDTERCEIPFTGERVVPGEVSTSLWLQHIKRYEFAATFVKDKIVLDIGCSTGYGTHFLRNTGAKEVVGIDISEDAIKYAQTHFDAKYLVGDTLRLPFENKQFDAVLCFEVIEHIPPEKRKMFLSESGRVLREKGVFICSTPNQRVCSSVFPYTKSLISSFHYPELSPQKFKKTLGKYFQHVTIYDQCKNNVFGAKLLNTFRHIFRVLPRGEKIKIIAKNIVEKNSALNVSQDYGKIESFENSFLSSYFTMIGVCKR